MPEAVVLVGRRRTALAAADALGVPVILVSQRPARDFACVIAWSPPHEPGNSASLARLAEHIQAQSQPVSVVALTEDSVLPAAQIRGALDLPGQTEAQALACTDKLVMKRAIRAAGLNCADFCSAADHMTREALIERLGMPMLIKPRIGSGSRGTRLIASEAEVPERLGEGDLAERLVSGREMSIESFILDGEVLFTNVSDYFEPGWANIVPADLTEDRRSQLETFNKAVLRALSLRQGVTHLEFFLQEKRVVFGEIAARPPGGYIMDLISRVWGFDAWQALIRLALGEVCAFPEKPGCFAGARLLHPGPGIVERVDGLTELSTLPAVQQISMRAYPGRRYEMRTGVGEEAGHIIATDTALEPVRSALRKAAQCIRFRMRQN